MSCFTTRKSPERVTAHHTAEPSRVMSTVQVRRKADGHRPVRQSGLVPNWRRRLRLVFLETRTFLLWKEMRSPTLFSLFMFLFLSSLRTQADAVRINRQNFNDHLALRSKMPVVRTTPSAAASPSPRSSVQAAQPPQPPIDWPKPWERDEAKSRRNTRWKGKTALLLASARKNTSRRSIIVGVTIVISILVFIVIILCTQVHWGAPEPPSTKKLPVQPPPPVSM